LIERLITALERKHIDITSTYVNWIKVGFAPIVIRLSETKWKYRLGLASNQHVPSRMLTYIYQ
jgi:hypothetical protein